MVKTTLDRFCRVLGVISGVLFGTVFLLTMTNIVSRNVGGVALRWIPGLTRLSFIWSVLIAATVLYRTREHLSVDYFVGKLGRRGGAVVRTVTDLLTIPFFVLVAVNGFRIAGVRMRISYETWDFPTGYAYLALPISVLILLLFNVERLLFFRKGSNDA